MIHTIKDMKKQFRWSNMKSGSVVNYNGRKYDEGDFVPQVTWVMIDGKEYLVSGWLETKQGETLGLIIHPDDDHRYRIINRKEVTVL